MSSNARESSQPRHRSREDRRVPRECISQVATDARPPPLRVPRGEHHLRLRVQVDELGDEVEAGRVCHGDEAGRQLTQQLQRFLLVAGLPGLVRADPFSLRMLQLVSPVCCCLRMTGPCRTFSSASFIDAVPVLE